jgi:hypothetical protein
LLASCCTVCASVSTCDTVAGWDRPVWAARGVKDGPELTRVREASVDVTYLDGGVEDTFARSWSAPIRL